jgi:hypothetical protein
MILPRSDFVQTMTDSEENIMKAHGDYLQRESLAWQKLVPSCVTAL